MAALYRMPALVGLATHLSMSALVGFGTHSLSLHWWGSPLFTSELAASGTHIELMKEHCIACWVQVQCVGLGAGGHLQLSLLLCRVHIRAKHPLCIGVGLINRALFDLEHPSIEPGPDLCQLHLPVARLDEHMVSERNKVVLVRKRHDPLRVILGNGEEELECRHNSRSQLGRESFKDEMRVLFGDGRVCVCRDLVSEHNIVQCEEKRGAVGEVRNNHRVWYTPVFMQYHHVGDPIRSSSSRKISYRIRAPIQPCRVGEQQSDLLGELREARAGIARGRHQNTWVVRPRARVLIIDTRARRILRCIEVEVASEVGGVLAAKLGGQRFARGERFADGLFAVVDLLFLGFERLFVDVLATLARLSSQHPAFRMVGKSVEGGQVEEALVRRQLQSGKFSGCGGRQFFYPTLADFRRFWAGEKK